MTTRSASRRTAGFTLIELMIVVAIIGILAAIAIPKFAELIRKSKEGSVKGNLGSVRAALTIYYSDTEGLFPGDHLECLAANAKYIKEIPSATVPGYHIAVSFSVDNNDDLGMNAIRIADDGEWKYWNWTTPSMTGNVHQGDFWIGCTHSDYKGSVWSAS
jgi:general secretion pathway protein G